jgi:microcystin degradation protein MlrC
MTRLAVARLWFCSNSFNPRRTRLADLRRHEWTEGREALIHPRAPRSDIEGVTAFLAAHPDWQVTVLRCAAAPSGGPLAADALGAWLADVESALRPGRFDALYLSLHGACQAEGDPAVETTVLRRLRLVARRLPIVASFDAQANLSEEMPLLLDGASIARGPGDGAAAAGRALALLEGILAGRIRPVGAVARVPAVLAPAALAGVMGALWRDGLDARALPLLDLSVCSGFAWADSFSTGPAGMAWADRDAGAAREAASALALQLARGREAAEGLPGPAETVIRAAAQGRVLILDPADDPEAGGLGDTPDLLRALVRIGPTDAALGVLVDPAALAAARAAGEGAEFDRLLGAGVTSVYGRSVVTRVRVERLRGEMAVLKAGHVLVLVAARPLAATPELFEAAGIDLARLGMLAVKGGAVARAAFARAFPVAVEAGSPGPASPDLSGLPYNFVPAARRTPNAAEHYASDQQRRADEAEGRDENRRANAPRRLTSLGGPGARIRIQA